MKKLFKTKSSKRFSLVIFPLLIMIVIFITSSWLFEQNKSQTYELIKRQKELAVNRLVYLADEAVNFTDVDHLTEEQKLVIKSEVYSLSEQPEVHCYLLNNKFELVSDYNDANMNEEDMKLLYALSHYDDLDSVIAKEDDNRYDNNYFTITIDKGTNYEFYWRKIPTNNTEFYVLVGISKDKIAVNKAVDTCKVFIGFLNVLLTISLYGNIVLLNRDSDNDEK